MTAENFRKTIEHLKRVVEDETLMSPGTGRPIDQEQRDLTAQKLIEIRAGLVKNNSDRLAIFDEVVGKKGKK